MSVAVFRVCVMPTGVYDRSHRRHTPEQRNESARRRIDRMTEIAPDTGCWNWLGAVSNVGYGRLQMSDGIGRSTARAAHRVSYEVHRGTIPDGLHLDHLCRNRRCVNPFHLQPVTPRENVWRAPTAPAFINGTKTHCRNNHPFDAANTYVDPKSGYRGCRVCRAAATRRHREARRTADAIAGMLD